MPTHGKMKQKLREWYRRYLPAELLGTAIALAAAAYTFYHTHSYLAATGAGLVGEGVGFYGYFVVTELLLHAHRYESEPFFKKIWLITSGAGTNLLVEFAPADILDSLLVRPVAMYAVPQVVKPYALGFLVGKLASDVVFYTIAVIGYEVRKRWLRRH